MTKPALASCSVTDRGSQPSTSGTGCAASSAARQSFAKRPRPSLSNTTKIAKALSSQAKDSGRTVIVPSGSTPSG